MCHTHPCCLRDPCLPQNCLYIWRISPTFCQVKFTLTAALLPITHACLFSLGHFPVAWEESRGRRLTHSGPSISRKQTDQQSHFHSWIFSYCCFLRTAFGPNQQTLLSLTSPQQEDVYQGRMLSSFYLFPQCCGFEWVTMIGFCCCSLLGTKLHSSWALFQLISLLTETLGTEVPQCVKAHRYSRNISVLWPSETPSFSCFLKSYFWVI